jgi:hypothetical protein
VTRRRKGGEHIHGFSYVDDGFSELFDEYLNQNELDGTYEVVDLDLIPGYTGGTEGTGGTGGAGGTGGVVSDENLETLLGGISFGAEADLDECGPIDAPYPCTARFIYPNTDVTLIDKYGFKSEHYMNGPTSDYAPLRTTTKLGVGRPIEIAKNRHKLKGMGIHNSYGHGNTFDIRFGFPVDPIECTGGTNERKCYGPRNAFDGEIEEYDFTDYIRMVHYTGKELPKQLRDFTEGE